MAISVFVLKFTNNFTAAVTFSLHKILMKCSSSSVNAMISPTSTLCHQVRDVSDTYVVNLPVQSVFTCKVAHQKSQKSMHICKRYCVKIRGIARILQWGGGHRSWAPKTPESRHRGGRTGEGSSPTSWSGGASWAPSGARSGALATNAFLAHVRPTEHFW